MSRIEPGSLWHDFADRLRLFVAGRVPAQDIDDVAQEIMLRLHEGVASLRDTARVESWVYGVARRAIADYYRVRASRGRVERAGIEGMPEPADESEDTHVHEQVLTWLRPFAEDLPDGYREALLMTDFEGQPQKRVAHALGLTLSGAKSRIQRARKMLGASLARCCELHFDSAGRVTSFQRRECGCDC